MSLFQRPFFSSMTHLNILYICFSQTETAGKPRTVSRDSNHGNRSRTSSSSCSVESFEACLSVIKSVTDSEQLAFASTEKELDKACRYALDYTDMPKCYHLHPITFCEMCFKCNMMPMLLKFNFFFSQNCRKLQHGLNCADDHMKRCATRSQRQVFEDVVKGTRDVISKLCIPGPDQRCEYQIPKKS